MNNPLSDRQASWWLSLTLSIATGLWSQIALAEKAKLAIIIDDLGYHQRGCQGVLELPGPLNLAYLPHTPYARDYAHLAHQAGHTIMLHLPMTSHSFARLGPGGLEEHMAKEQLRRIMLNSLYSIPHVSGFNNHMGSFLTEMETIMATIMTVAREERLFFVDSRTSAKTVAQQAAIDAGIPNMRRHVFLDNDTREAALAKQFDLAVRRARRQGLTVIIGHPYPETIAFLKKRLIASADEIELVSLKHQLTYTAVAEDIPAPAATNHAPELPVAETPMSDERAPCSWCRLDRAPVDPRQTGSDSGPALMMQTWPQRNVQPATFE